MRNEDEEGTGIGTRPDPDPTRPDRIGPATPLGAEGCLYY